MLTMPAEARGRLVTASANRELDEILDLLVVSLQLTRPQFDDAEGKYHTASRWLSAESSPLRLFFPDIYSQGSMRIDTTVRPLSFTEFDLDLVCRLLVRGKKPLEVYALLLDRLRSNGHYAKILEAKPRCIRLNYAGQFHLDIIPAIQDPDCSPLDTRTRVPDREKRVWLLSNPKGFAVWFEAQAARRILMEKAAQFSANANVEPLPEPEPVYSKQPLKLAVQLLKRWRDVTFKDRERLAPPSIVLTTLSGKLYRGEHHPTDAVATIVDGIYQWSQREDIRLENPANPGETITDRWDDSPDSYNAFIEEITLLRSAWLELMDHGRYPDFIDDLKLLFGNLPVVRAVTKFAELRHDAGRSGRLYVAKPTGILSVAAAPAMLPGYVRSKEHTFHGE